MSIYFFDAAYEQAGATISSVEIFKCDILLKINKPSRDEIEKLSSNQTLISFFSPATNSESLQICSKDKLNILSMDPFLVYHAQKWTHYHQWQM